MTLLQNLCWNSLIGTVQMHQKVLFSSRDTSSTRGSARPYRSRVGLLVEQPGLAADSFLALRSTQNSLSPSQRMGHSNTPKYRICCLQNPNRPTKECASFLVLGSVWCNNSSFTFNENAPTCLTTLEPVKMSLMWQAPESFKNSSLSLRSTCVLPRHTFTTSCSSDLINKIPSIKVDQWSVLQNVQMIQLSLVYITVRGKWT